MLEPVRIESNIKPEKFEDLGNGNWYYNYDIQSKVVNVNYMNEEKEETRYNYIQIKMQGKPDYKRCVERVIREFITQSQEFDLINSYNKAMFNLSKDVDKASIDYMEYLQKIQEIKDNIKEDFN